MSQHIRQVLKAHDGDTNTAAESLTKTQNEQTQRIADAKAEEMGKGSEPAKSNSKSQSSGSLLKNNLSGNKGEVVVACALDYFVGLDSNQTKDILLITTYIVLVLCR
ncbi:hypothetical protein PoB_003506000 [Plakobranchus ocellatus]|uniref:Uncharacterized protein n=1 Tax=Plakobranchus ocellatus TaxID=259542 RepID=A0AAV4AMH9_9GAST|nr:hypothetical protein PoB_003506000 [Plakobranchus ocellatus]